MKRVVIMGIDDSFTVYFSKYLILNNIEVYFVIRKDEELQIIKELGNKVTVVRYDGNTEHLKLFFKSIEPDVVYNLSGVYKDKVHYKNTRELLDKNFCYIIDILEALTENSKIRLVNMVNKIDENNNLPKDLYSVVIKSLQYVVKYYNDNGMKIVIKHRTGDEKVDIENLLSIK